MLARFVLAVLTALLFCSPVKAEAPSTEQKVAAAVLLTADWLQTRYIARHPDRYYEFNPLLGKHPSIGAVNNHYLAVGLLGYGLTELGVCNRYCYNVFIAFEAANVARNFSIGVRFQF